MRALRYTLLAAHTFALRHPRLIIALSLLLMLALGTQVPKMKVLISIAELVEEKLSSTEKNQQLRADFSGGNSLFVILEPGVRGSGLSRDETRRIRSWIERERARGEDLLRVTSPYDLQRFERKWWRLQKVPVVSADGAAGLQRLRGSPWEGILTDASARDIGVEFVFKNVPEGSRFGRFDPSVVGSLRERCVSSLGGESSRVRLYLAGSAAWEYYVLEGVRRFQLLNLLVLVLILLLFRCLFGTWRSGLLLIGLLLVVGFSVYGAMSLAGAPIDFLSTGLFLILAVAALEDYLFLSHQQLTTAPDWQTLFRDMLVPSFLTSLTTLIGFGSLCASDLAIVRRFGLWAGIGAVVEWGVTFLLLPAFMQICRSCRTWTDPGRAWQVTLPSRLTALSLPKWWVFVLLAVYVGAFYSAPHLNTSDSPITIFPEGHPYRDGLAYLHRSRGWVGEISVVFADSNKREANQAVVRALRRHPNVARVIDPYAVISYATEGRVKEPRQIAEFGLPHPAGYGTLFSESGRARAILYLNDVGLDRLKETVDSIEGECLGKGCHAAGDLVSYADFAGEVPDTLFKSLATCLLLVGIILVLLVRALGPRHVAAVLLGSFWGPACMMVVLWALQIPLNFLTCVFASVLVGLTGDNVIQYLFAGEGASITGGIKRRGGASMQVALVMGLASLSFLGSSFVPSRRLGALLSVGLVASLVGDVWLLKGLVGTQAPRGSAPVR